MPHLHAVPDEFAFESEEDAEVRLPPLKAGRTETRTANGVEHEFMSGTSDKHGHNVQFNVRHPPAMNARVQYIARHPSTPYRSDQDVWRDAMYHHITLMEQFIKDPAFTRQVRLMQQQLRIDQMQRDLELDQQLVTSTAEYIRQAIRSKDWARVREAIERGQEVVAESTVDTKELIRAVEDAERELTSQ